MTKVLVTMSGGVDSTVALASRMYGDEVYAVTIDNQGSFFKNKQRRFIEQLIEYFGLRKYHYYLTSTNPDDLIVNSAKTGAYEDYIPGYQCLLNFPVLALADKLNITKIITGTTMETTRGGRTNVFVRGRTINDDTSGAFCAMAELYNKLYDTHIRFVHPFLELKKSEIISRFAFLEVPFDKTNSCEDVAVNSELVWHCGICHKCQERKLAFMEADIEDKVKYLV